jgi:hypothetical protein
MQALVGISSSFSCPHSGQRKREIRIGSAIEKSSGEQNQPDDNADGSQDSIGG